MLTASLVHNKRIRYDGIIAIPVSDQSEVLHGMRDFEPESALSKGTYIFGVPDCPGFLRADVCLACVL